MSVYLNIEVLEGRRAMKDKKGPVQLRLMGNVVQVHVSEVTEHRKELVWLLTHKKKMK